MNKSFKSIWCEKTGTYIAAAELSRSKGKKSSSAVLAAGLGIVVGLFAMSGSAFAAPTTDGSLQLCSPTGAGMSSGSAGSNTLNCTGVPVSFSLNNQGDGKGGEGFGVATARVTGYNDGLLELKGNAGISMVGQVEMNGNKITGLAAGAESATSTDAVNGSQLFATNQNAQANAANIATNTANIAGNTTSIATNTANIASNTTNIASNTTNIANNATSISTIDGRVTNVEGSVTTLTQQMNSGGVGLVKQDATSEAITVAKDTGGLSVDFTGTGGARVLSGVAAGNESETSTDAVNGSQLFATNQNVQANAANIATNTTNIASNTANIASNTANIASNTTNIANNAANISTVDGRMTNVEGSVTNLTQQLSSGSVGLVQQDAVTGDFTVAKGMGGMSVDFTGTSGARVLNGVAAGRLAVGSQEAVNGSQLFATDQNVQANTTNIASNTANITKVEGRVNNVENSVTNLTQQLDGGSVGLVKQDGATEAITVAKDTGGTSVDFTGTSGARVLSGVGAGRLAADSQEAVNGSQLFATNQNVQINSANIATNTANIASNMAAIVEMGGRVNSVESSMSNLTQQMDTKPPIVVDKVDSAVQYSGSQLATNGDASQPASASGDKAVAIGAGATASANNSVALGAGSQTGNRENTVSVGSVGNERAIANVADGVAGTDAVNKRQLDAVSASSQAYTDERINQVQSDIADVRRDANGAAASAMAVATLPQSIIPGRGMASAAMSNMNGESAVAVGISKVSENSRWVTKIAGTVNTRGNLGVSAGIGFHW